jgi:Zn-dependent protease
VTLADGALKLAILLVSVILHENAHGLVARSLGDQTAKASGRITLNPLKHLDPVGSVILPLLLFFTAGGRMFGYAKPVPVNPHNLRGKDKWGFAVVALAGPVCNMILVVIAAFFLKHRSVGFDVSGNPVGGMVAKGLVFAFELNLLLAAFNLVPIPPLDGSRLIRPFLGNEGRRVLDRIEPFGFVILLVMIVWLEQPLFRLVGIIESGLLRVLPV